MTNTFDFETDVTFSETGNQWDGQAEQGITIEEDGVTLKWSANAETPPSSQINSGTQSFNNADGFISAQCWPDVGYGTTIRTAFGRPTNNPPSQDDIDAAIAAVRAALESPPQDVYTLEAADTDGDGFRDGNLTDPTFDISWVVGEWEARFYKEDGTWETVTFGSEVRDANTWLDPVGGATVSATGTFTHVEFQCLSATMSDASNWDPADHSYGTPFPYLPNIVIDDVSFDYAVVCFLKGTLIDTVSGPVPVETLAPGDVVVTADGGTTPVLWLGKMRVNTRFSVPGKVTPVRISAGALGDGLPRQDLYVSGDHGMIIDGFVINASALVNGNSIDWVPDAELPERITFYHVETENHDVILANGAPTETFLDIPGRRAFDNYGEYVELYGAERIIPEMPAVRILAKRLLPEDIKMRLGFKDEAVEASFENEGLDVVA